MINRVKIVCITFDGHIDTIEYGLLNEEAAIEEFHLLQENVNYETIVVKRASETILRFDRPRKKII